MAGTSRFKKALHVITSFFEESPKKVFSRQDMVELLDSMRKEWNLPDGMYVKSFIEQLTNYSVLKTVEIKSNTPATYTRSELERYAFGNVSPFEVALSIRANTRLSHFSSMFLLGLTEQIPKNIYVTFEQSIRTLDKQDNINQELIDKAFGNPQREPSVFYTYSDYKITLLSSKFSKNAGVIKLSTIYGRNLSVTNLERTLIDITVRPVYAGGVTEVLKAYEKASENLSVNKLLSILNRINFIYPYRQSIGFYLEKSGKYRLKQIELLDDREKKYDFYLSYDMKDKKYSSHWKLFYPKNL